MQSGFLFKKVIQLYNRVQYKNTFIRNYNSVQFKNDAFNDKDIGKADKDIGKAAAAEPTEFIESCKNISDYILVNYGLSKYKTSKYDYCSDFYDCSYGRDYSECSYRCYYSQNKYGNELSDFCYDCPCPCSCSGSSSRSSTISSSSSSSSSS